MLPKRFISPPSILNTVTLPPGSNDEYVSFPSFAILHYPLLQHNNLNKKKQPKPPMCPTAKKLKYARHDRKKRKYLFSVIPFQMA